MPLENRAMMAFIALCCIALGSALTFGIDRLNAPKPVIISNAVAAAPVPPPAPSQVTSGIEGREQSSGAPSRKRSHSPKSKKARTLHKKITSGVVHLNSATLDDLEQLPGVGPSTAQAIIDFRTQAGGFTSFDKLGDVPRMGAKKLAKLMPFVAL
jgi:competence protein ComEA